MQPGFRIAMFISGEGPIAQAIIQACFDGRLRGVIPALIVSSKPRSRGLVYAKRLGMRANQRMVINPQQFKTQEQFGEKLIRECRKRRIDFIGLYDWRPTPPANLVDAYAGKIVRNHPGPLDPGRPDFGGPEMYGMRVHAARLEYLKLMGWRDQRTEVSSQLMQPDGLGPVIGCTSIFIEDRDWSPEELGSYTSGSEQTLQMTTIHNFLDGKLKEVVREEPLIPLENIPLLEQAKEKAIAAYPDG